MHGRRGDVCRIAYWCKFWILVPVRMFRSKKPVFLVVKVSFRIARDLISIYMF